MHYSVFPNFVLPSCMKNGLIGSEETTITWAHSIDPVSVWYIIQLKKTLKRQLSSSKVGQFQTKTFKTSSSLAFWAMVWFVFYFLHPRITRLIRRQQWRSCIRLISERLLGIVSGSLYLCSQHTFGLMGLEVFLTLLNVLFSYIYLSDPVSGNKSGHFLS